MTIDVAGLRKVFLSTLSLACFLFFTGMILPSVGQTSSTDGATPLVLTPGSPTGSYPLSGLDNVNLVNGNLNFHLPLFHVAGRGDAQYTITLPIEEHWRVLDRSTDFQEIYLPTDFTWYGDKPGYGPGILLARVVATNSSGSGAPCGAPNSSFYGLTRFTFIAPDGTEYEFRDQNTGGEQKLRLCSQGGFNRGKVFVTADGTAATFIADADVLDQPGTFTDRRSGYLVFRNGLRYKIDNLGRVSWMRDRNGNKLSFDYGQFGVTTITDSLNRQITISYADFQTVFYDQISFKGFGGAARTIRVNYSPLHNALRTNRPGDLASVQTPHELFPELTGSSTTPHDPYKVSSVVLPDGVQQYQFLYNVYSELARVVLPTGGLFEFDFAAGTPNGNPDGVVDNTEIYRRVTAKRVYKDLNTLDSKTVFDGTTVDVFDANNNLLTRQKHYFFADESVGTAPFNYPKWNAGKEYQTEVINTANCVPSTCTTVLQRTVNSWQQGVTVSPWSTAIPNNPRIYEITSTLADVTPNLISKRTFGYDDSVPFNNVNSVKEYDFGSATPARETRTTYLTSSTYTGTNVHLRNLPLQISVYDAASSEKARTVFQYDNYIQDGTDCLHSFHCPLSPRSSVSGFDTTFDVSYTTRGNRTATTQYFMVNGLPSGSISAYALYDVLGNVLRLIDPRSTTSNIIATTFEYEDRFGSPDGNAETPTTPSELSGLSSFAFPSKVTNAAGHTGYTQLDYYLGRPVDAEDANGVVASGYYIDGLDRPTQIRRAVGTLLQNQTTFAYDDANHVITTTSDRDMNPDNILVSRAFYDQMGRTIETRNYEDASNYISIQTQYDPLGRAFKTSYPFRPWQGQSPVWTTQAFDALGRVVSITTPDGAAVATAYSGDRVLVTDQAGKQRISRTNALAQLKDVWEITTSDSATEAISFPSHSEVTAGYRTTYAYDVLNNMTTVTQGSQQRFFMYDSLKHLIRSRYPEQTIRPALSLSDPITGNNDWSTAYEYDNGGNLTKKTDARGVESTYVYDVLNRNTEVGYSDTPFNPDVRHFYDGATKGVGRFWYSTRGNEADANNMEKTSVDSYDVLGRPLTKQQSFKLNNEWKSFPVSRTYNLAGGVLTQTYPSLRGVSYSYDSAGRTSSFSGDLGNNPRTYATGITYSPWGGISYEQFGTNTLLYRKSLYNIRGQLFDMRLSSVNNSWDWNRGKLILMYSSNHGWGESGTDNNGNILSAQTLIPPPNATTDQTDTFFEDNYSYDSLNRLVSVTEQKMSVADGWGLWTQQFRQQYTYDRYGNRTINAAQTWGTGINNKPFDPNVGNKNQLGVPSGQSGTMTYDYAGNLTNDTYTGAGAREYDAENKMTKAWGGNNQWQEYTYNADGQRTRRKVNGSETWQIYGMDGELLAEYAAGASKDTPQKEYGYRNGQLLITASPGSSSGSSSNSLSVNGTTAYAEVPNSTNLNIVGPLTMEAWVKLPAVSTTYRPILDHSPSLGNEGGYDMYVTDTGKARMDIFYYPSYQYLIGATTLTANVWHHIAGVYDGSQLRLYVDGQLDGSVNLSSPMTGTAVQLRIGRNNYLYTPIYFNGLIDEVRISTGALYSSNFTPAASLTASSSTRGLWKFDGQTASDSSANGNNGTLNGGATYSSDVPSGGGGGGPESVVWTGATNVTVNGNSLTKSAAAAWDAGANSTKAIVSGNGYVEMTITETNKDRFFGLSDSETTVSYEDIDFSMRAYSNGVVYCYEPGTNGAFCGYYSPGDKLRVAIESGAVKYYLISGSTSNLVYTATHPATYPMAADAAIYDSGGTVTNAVISGNLSSGGGGGGSSSSVQWLVMDHLGTPRMIVDQTGSYASVKRHDYLPFGEEIFAGVASRTTSLGYTGGDGVRQQFTSKERDLETGLDYVNARYFASMQGRFTSPDPLLESGTAQVPQSWNRYSYALNNPLAFIDPSGLIWGRVNGEGNPIWYKTEAEMIAAGAQAFNPPYNTYQAEDGRWIDLNPNGPGSEPNYEWNPYSRPEDPYYRNGWDYTSDPHARPEPEAGLENKFDHMLIAVGLGQFFANAAKGITSSLLTSEAPAVTNPVPNTLARVIPGEGPYTTLGRAGAEDVFVTAADDIAGMSAEQLGPRLGIPNSKTFTIIEFPTPPNGLASPVFRTNPGFTGFGRTIGGAREFVIPNGPVPVNSVVKIVQ